MTTRTARGDLDFSQIPDIVVGDSRSRKADLSSRVHTSVNRLTHGLRLFINLLEHVVRESAFARLWMLAVRNHEVMILANRQKVATRRVDDGRTCGWKTGGCPNCVARVGGMASKKT